MCADKRACDAAAEASRLLQALLMQHVSVCQAARRRSSADGAAEEDGWRWMKMDEDGWRCCRVRNSAGILLCSPQLRGWNTSMSRAVVPSSPWTLTHAVLLHKHSARHQTWIHPPLKIVPDRNSASSCLCDRTCELSATDRKLLRLVNNSRPVAVLWLNCFMFLMLRLLLVVASLITCSSGVCEQKHTETFQASILSQYVT